MDDGQFGAAVPAFSLYVFRKIHSGHMVLAMGQDGLYPLKGTSRCRVPPSMMRYSERYCSLARMSHVRSIFGQLFIRVFRISLLINWPQGNKRKPVATGKPFINNFLPNGGDMLRLNMAVPTTPEISPDIWFEGLISAAVLGFTIQDIQHNYRHSCSHSKYGWLPERAKARR